MFQRYTARSREPQASCEQDLLLRKGRASGHTAAVTASATQVNTHYYFSFFSQPLFPASFLLSRYLVLTGRRFLSEDAV